MSTGSAPARGDGPSRTGRTVDASRTGHTDENALPQGTTASAPVGDCCSHAPSAAGPAPGYHDAKAAYLRRLRLIEGQVRGLQRMIEGDVYCIDVLTQVAAASKAMESMAIALVDDHVQHCVHEAAASGDAEVLDQKIDEVMTAVKRLLR